MSRQIENFIHEQPPRENSLVNEIVLKNYRGYQLFLGVTVVISFICSAMVYYIEYPAVRHSFYLLAASMSFLVLPAYVYQRLIKSRIRTVAANGVLIEGVAVTSVDQRGFNKVGIEAKLRNLNNSTIYFALIPAKPPIVIGERIPMLYCPESPRILIAYFKKCGFNVGHAVKLVYRKWFLSICIIVVLLAAILWRLFHENL